ncbi:MAG: disulfide bond formation protein B [Limnobacter sp.]
MMSKAKVAMAGVLLSAAALGSALYVQEVMQWFPCPLCIVQRYAYLVVASGFLLALFSAPHGLMRNFAQAVAGLGAIGGAGAAFYHVWVLANPAQTCGVDPLQLKLNALPWVQWWPAMFTSDGLCSDVYPPLFGLSLPLWSGLGFVAASLLTGLLVKARR